MEARTTWCLLVWLRRTIRLRQPKRAAAVLWVKGNGDRKAGRARVYGLSCKAIRL